MNDKKFEALVSTTLDLYGEGNHYEAMMMFEEFCEYNKKNFGANESITLSFLSSVAIAYNNLGNHDKTLVLQKECYKLRKQVFGEVYPDTLDGLHDLAVNYSNLGNYEKSLELNQKCYELRKQVLGETHPNTLNSLNNLAIDYFNLGNYEKSLKLSKTCYELRKEVLGKKHTGTLNSLNGLAVNYNNLGNHEKSLKLQKECYELRKQKLGEKHPHTLVSLNNLASIDGELGNYEKSLELFKKCYELTKQVLGEMHPDTLDSLYNLAVNYSCLGNYEKSLKLEKKCYESRKQVLGEIHPDTLSSLRNLAIEYYNTNDYDNYENTIKSYYDSMNSQIFNIISLRQETNYKNYLHSFIDSTRDYIEYYFEKKNNIKDYHYISAYKNIIQDIEMLEYHLKKIPEYHMNINYLSELDKRIMESHNQEQLVNIQKERERVNDQLSVLTKDYQDNLFLDINYQMIQTKLKFNDIILDYYDYDDNHYGLVIIGKDIFESITLEKTDDYESLVSQARKYINKNTHIYICPDGELYNLSFERILEDYEISYLSSPKGLFYKPRTDDQSQNREIISFVYPDFNDMMDDEHQRGNPKGVLYGSYIEGLYMKDIYQDKCFIYSKKEANHDNFMNVNNPRVLHISTHGEYDDNEEIMNPMERGKLCLAGYNQKERIEEYGKGYVTAGEIQPMNLKDTDLVVLSACNTGIGETIKGEGLYGIRRAFELAGAKTLLITVEEIDDYNTAIFMKVFYERYQENKKIYESFKNTREYLSDKDNALRELQKLKETFQDRMKSIAAGTSYERNLDELENRIRESQGKGNIVKKSHGKYIEEDWKGIVIQGNIEN